MGEKEWTFCELQQIFNLMAAGTSAPVGTLKYNINYC
jgi:hypothetical protein